MSEVPSDNGEQSPADKALAKEAKPRLASEIPQEPDAAIEEAPTPSATESKDKPPKARRRTRWWWRWTKRLAVAGLVARVLLWLFLEHLADFGAGFAGLSVSWRSASLSINGLSLHIEDLVVRDANDEQAPPLLTAQDVLADLSMRQLLGGQLSVVDASIAGARVTVHRGADGQLRLPKSWLEPAAVAVPEPDAQADDAPFSFELPCWIHSTRLHDLQLDFVDNMVAPARKYTGKLDLDVADLGFPDRNGSIMLRMHAPQLCDELFVHTQVQAQTSLAKCEFQAAVRGFRPQKFALPQDVLAILQNAHVVDVRLAGNLSAEVLASAPRQPALAGTVDFGLSLDGIERSTLACNLGPTEVTASGTVDEGMVTPFSLTLQIDNVVDVVRLEEGRLELSDARFAVTARLVAKSMTCGRLRPMLKAAGLSLPDCGIDLNASLDADFGDAMSIDLARITIGSANGGEQVALDRFAVRDLRTVDDTLAIGSVVIVGPDLPVRLEADGSLAIAGLHLASAPTTTSPEVPAAGATPATTPPVITLPKIRLGSLNWSGARLAYTDSSFKPAADLVLRDLSVTADAITIGEAAPPGRLLVSFAVPDVVRRCTAELTVHSRASGLKADLQWTTDGMTLRGLQPWLQPLGIETELTDGTLALTLGADVEFTAQGIHADAQLVNVKLLDGDSKWLSLRSARGEGMVIADGTFDAGTWTVRDPFVKAHRDQAQVLHALGLQIGAPAAPPAPTSPSPASPSPTAPATNPSPSAALQHGKLILDRTTLAFSDARFPDRVFSIGLDASIGANDGLGAAVPVHATIRLDRAVKSCTLDAELQLQPTQTSLRGTFATTGMQGSELAMLLPDGIACTLDNGSVHAAFDAVITHRKSTAINSSLRDIRLMDGDTELAAIDEVVVKIPLIRDDELHIEDAHIAGMRAVVTMTQDALHVPGFSIAQPKVPAATVAAPQPPAEPNAATDSQPAPEPPPPLKLPKLRIDALALKLDRLELRDRRGKDAEPIVLGAGIELREPWIGDAAADEPAPMHVVISGKVLPLGATLVANTTVDPFDLTPTIDVDFSLSGIDTTQLARVSPALAEQLRGEAKSLSATAKLHAVLYLKRREPSVFDFNRPFGAEVVVENFVVKDAAGEKPFLSIASIDAIVRAVDTRSGSVLMRSVTIDEPVLRVEKDANGTHVAGFRLPPAKAATTETKSESPRPSAAARANPTGEFAVDRFHLLGLQVDYRDATTEPPTHLSLTDTDVELRRFSTRAFTEPRPMAFSIAVRGGDVELERRILRSSLIAGVLSSGANALVGSCNQHELVQRAMLDEFTAKGQLQLFPKAKGRVNFALHEFELAALRGLAKSAGVDLADGLYDMSARLDLLGHDGLTLQSQNVFTYLALDEPPNGPIATYLRLPAPLQSILFLLRNSDDQQRIAISVRVPADGIRKGAIASLAIESLLKLIGDATTSVGNRLINAGTAGFAGGQSQVPDLAAEVSFAAGSPLPTTDTLSEMAAALRSDETLTIVLTHELGQADQQHAHELANPTAEVLHATLTRLAARRAQLEARRIPLAAEVVALYAAGKSHEAIRKQAELGEVDDNLGELLAALDQTIDQLGNRNPRKSLRRTRTAALALAEARLDAVSSHLLRACPDLANGTGLLVPRIERRPGRGVPIADSTGAGRIVAVLRRRTAQDLPAQRVKSTRTEPRTLDPEGFTPVPPVADPSNRAFNSR